MKTFLSICVLSLCLMACGGDAALLVTSPPDPPVGTIPVMVSVSPAMNSRTAPTKMTIAGTNLNAIMPSASWSFPGYPGCAAATYVGVPVSASTYELTITPGPAAAVGDICDLRLQQGAPYPADQTLRAAFSTGL